MAVNEPSACPTKISPSGACRCRPDVPCPDVSVGPVQIGNGVMGIAPLVSISAPISNSGPAAVPAVPCRLIVDGKTASTITLTDLPFANGSVVAHFDYTFTLPGVSLGPDRHRHADALEADNVSTSAVNVVDKLPVLVIDGQLTSMGRFRGSEFLQAAFQPVEETQEATTLIQPRLVTLSDVAARSWRITPRWW